MARARFVDVCDLDALRRQVMHGVGVVPEQTEIARGRRHLRQPFDGLHPNTPCRTGLLYFGTHHMPLICGSAATSFSTASMSGPASSMRHRDHLDAELRADRKVPVVAGHRADERDARFARPRLVAVDRALQQRIDDGVMHQRQAGVVAEDDAIGADTEDRRQLRAQFRQPLQLAVVAAVHAAGHEVRARQAQQLIAQVELARGRFAAGEIEFQFALGKCLVAAADVFVAGAQFVGAEGQSGYHGHRGWQVSGRFAVRILAALAPSRPCSTGRP